MGLVRGKLSKQGISSRSQNERILSFSRKRDKDRMRAGEKKERNLRKKKRYGGRKIFTGRGSFLEFLNAKMRCTVRERTATYGRGKFFFFFFFFFF